MIAVNEPAAFVTHVSDLLTLEPRKSGSVTFILRLGSAAPIKHIEPKPARDGIYIPELTFPKPGDWTVSLAIPLEGKDHVISLPPIKVYASHEELHAALPAGQADGISFLKEQQWKVPTKTETVQLRQTGDTQSLAVPESAIVDEGDDHVVFVQLAGETFEERSVETGRRAGGFVHILSCLSSGDRAVTKGANAVAEAQYAIGGHDHGDEQVVELTQDEIERYAIELGPAGPGQIEVHVSVFQKDLPLVKAGQQVKVAMEPAIGKVQGKISYVGPIVGEKTRTAPARIVLDNTSGTLRPGTFVTAEVLVDKVTAKVVVPKDVIQEINDNPAVFVKSDHGFEPRTVTLGRANDVSVEIVSGLRSGDQIVTKNSFRLKAELEGMAAEEGIPETMNMPHGLEMGAIASGMGKILSYYVKGDDYSTTDLRTIQDWVVKRDIQQVLGVAKVISQGGHVRQYQIRVHPARLLEYDPQCHLRQRSRQGFRGRKDLWHYRQICKSLPQGCRVDKEPVDSHTCRLQACMGRTVRIAPGGEQEIINRCSYHFVSGPCDVLRPVQFIQKCAFDYAQHSVSFGRRCFCARSFQREHQHSVFNRIYRPVRNRPNGRSGFDITIRASQDTRSGNAGIGNRRVLLKAKAYPDDHNNNVPGFAAAGHNYRYRLGSAKAAGHCRNRGTRIFHFIDFNSNTNTL